MDSLYTIRKSHRCSLIPIFGHPKCLFQKSAILIAGQDDLERAEAEAEPKLPTRQQNEQIFHFPSIFLWCSNIFHILPMFHNVPPLFRWFFHMFHANMFHGFSHGFPDVTIAPQVAFEKARQQSVWQLLRGAAGVDRQLLAEIARLASGGAPRRWNWSWAVDNNNGSTGGYLWQWSINIEIEV